MSDSAILNIEVKADSADKAKKSLADLTAQGGKTERAMVGVSNSAKTVNSSLDSVAGSVKGLIGAYAGLAGVVGFAKISDEYTKFNAQLKIATGSQREFNQALRDVNAIATATQSSISTVSTLYSRLNNSLKDIGVNQADVARITETVGLSLKVAGSSAEEAGSAMLQLSQAFGSGVLRGDEFNSLMEATPNLMRALAASIGVPIGKLRDMAAEGKLTADVLTKAFTDDNLLNKLRGQSKEIETISGNLQLLQNSVVNIAGTFSQKTGLVSLFTTAIKDLNTTLQVLAGTSQLDFKLDKFLPDYSKFRAKLNSEALPANNGSKNGNILAQGALITDAIPRIDIGKIGDADTAFNKLKGTLLDLQKVNPLKDTVSKQLEYAANIKTVNDLESAGLLSVQEATRYRAQFNEELKKGTTAKKSELDTVLANIKLTQQENLLLAQGIPLQDAKAIAQLKANGATDAMIVSTLNAQQANEKLLETYKFEQDFYDSFEKSIVSQGEALDAQTESIINSARALEDENSSYGKLPSAITDVTIARLADKQAMLEGLGLVVPEIEAQIKAYEKLKDAQNNKEALDRNKKVEDDRVAAAKKSADDIAKAFEKASDDINKSLTDALLRGFESGKSFAKNFRDTLVNMFKTLILRPVISMIVSPVSGAITTALGSVFSSGSAVASTGAAAGGSSSLLGSLNAIKNVIGGVQGSLASSISTFGGWVSSLGSSGTGFISDSLSSLGSSISLGSSAIANALPYAGALLQLAQGNVKGAAFTATGAAIGSIIPGVGTAIGAVIGSVLGSFIGGNSKGHREGANVSGSFSNGEFSNGAVNKGTATYFNAGYVSPLQSLSKVFATELGTLLKGFSLSDTITTNAEFKAKQKGGKGNTKASFGASINGVSIFDVFDYKQKDSESFTKYVNSVLGSTMVKAIKSSSLTEGIKALFNGLSDKTKVTNMINASLALNSAQEQLAKRFGLTVDQAAKVSTATKLSGDSLIEYVNKLASSASAFNTAGDVILKAKANLADALGTDVPDSLNAFDAALKSIDKTTKAGIESFVEMFSLRDSFAAFTQTLDNLKGGVKGALYSIVSDTEKQAMLNADLAKAFGDLGLSVPTSIQDLITLGKSIDFTSKEGLDLASVFPSLVTAFNQTQTAVDGLMNSLRDINEFTTLVDFKRYKGLATNYGNAFANNYVDGMSSNVAASNSINTPVATTIVPTSNNTTISTSDPNLLQAIQTLTAQVLALQASSDKTATNTKRAADILVNVSPNGNALQTEAVV